MGNRNTAAREAARQRAEASRQEHARLKRPMADAVDAAVARAAAAILIDVGFWQQNSLNIDAAFKPVRLIIGVVLDLERRGFDRKQVCLAVEKRLKDLAGKRDAA